MKMKLIKSYLSKLTSLAVQFHHGEASQKDLIQLRLLIAAFQSYLKVNKVNPDVSEQIKNIRKLSIYS